MSFSGSFLSCVHARLQDAEKDLILAMDKCDSIRRRARKGHSSLGCPKICSVFWILKNRQKECILVQGFESSTSMKDCLVPPLCWNVDWPWAKNRLPSVCRTRRDREMERGRHVRANRTEEAEEMGRRVDA